MVHVASALLATTPRWVAPTIWVAGALVLVAVVLAAVWAVHTDHHLQHLTDEQAALRRDVQRLREQQPAPPAT